MTDRPTHYFAERPGAPSARRSVRLALRDVRLALATDAGVFSAEAVDAGTMVLLESVPPPPDSGDLLDLGCGYGPVALTLACRAPGATVWAVDPNERARELTRQNAAGGGLANVRVAAPEAVPDEVRFAAIWSNPPIRVGKDALHALLLHWLTRLTPDGAAHLVVHRHLGADSLQRWLVGQGFDVRRLTSRRGYRVLAVPARQPAVGTGS